MKQITILGLGLMGGSLGLALRKSGCVESVHGYARRAETRDAALAQGVVDRVFDNPAEAVEGAEVVALCTPILVIPELARQCRDSWREGCVVTDVGSTKVELVREMEQSLRGSGAVFVGSHPIAGSQKTGLEAARSDLYGGAQVVVTRSSATPDAAFSKIVRLWKDLGSEVVVMTPEKHDEVIARTSHLPHLVAAMLAEQVGSEADETVQALCGSGFRDTTRVAGGSDEIWHDIVKTNREFVGRELDRFSSVLDMVRKMVADGKFEELKTFLARSREIRRQFDA